LHVLTSHHEVRLFGRVEHRNVAGRKIQNHFFAVALRHPDVVAGDVACRCLRGTTIPRDLRQDREVISKRGKGGDEEESADRESHSTYYTRWADDIMTPQMAAGSGTTSTGR